MSPILAAALKRDRMIIASGLAGVATLSWTYLIYMDWGMRHMDVGMDMVIMPAMQHWTAWDLVLVFLMWVVMMVAMMVPTVSPMILFFAEINRHRNQRQGTFVSTAQFLLGYLTVWTGFSVLAALTQWGLLTVALVSPMMESTSKALGGALLLGAGLFQFSPLKYACLAHCRSPMGFIVTEWRGGAWGAFRMGLKHGGYCLGCCWALPRVFGVPVTSLVTISTTIGLAFATISWTESAVRVTFLNSKPLNRRQLPARAAVMVFARRIGEDGVSEG